MKKEELYFHNSTLCFMWAGISANYLLAGKSELIFHVLVKRCLYPLTSVFESSADDALPVVNFNQATSSEPDSVGIGL